MAKRIVPLVLILGLVGYFGHRFWTEKKALEQDESFYGTVEAVEVLVSAQVTGRITGLFVDEGQRIEQGLPVATIDDQLYRAQVEQARAAVASAKSQFAVLKAELKGVRIALARIRKLLSTGSATEMQLDDLETKESVLKAQEEVLRAQVVNAETALRFAETQLSYTRIEAPVSGTVIRRDVELGETVLPGSALMTLADLSSMEVNVYVPGPMLGKIRLGQRVDLITDSYPDQRLSGSVATIADESEFTPKNVQTRDERVRLVYQVKVRVPNPEGILKTGMPVDAWFVEE
jgi:HlyD family secretion protein